MKLKLPPKRSSAELKKSVILINRFTTIEGKQDAFIQTQIGEYKRLQGKVKGSLTVKLHRATDGKTVINYARFATEEDYHNWVQSDLFREHKKIIEPYVLQSDPVLVDVVYEEDQNGEKNV